MTDHIEVLRRLIKCASGRADFTASDAREADELLAALSAREGGEAVQVLRNNVRGAGKTTGHAAYVAKSRSVKQIVPPKKPYPKPDETGNDTGPCCAHAYADGWNECREAFLHPAQPASQPPYQSPTDSAGIGSSQQGDSRRDLYSELAEALGCDAMDSHESRVNRARRLSGPQAHPTGDRVRGLVEKWRADDAACTRAGFTESAATFSVCADQLAAALDQEKGR
jgi:hypothetical protein